MDSYDETLLFRDDDKIYVADFPKGRYITKTFTSNELPEEGDFKVSPKVSVRITYIKEKNDLRGIEIKKIGGKEKQRLILSSFDFKMLLATLKFFSEIDLASVANKSFILDESIFQNGDLKKIKKFLSTLAADPDGRKLLSSLENVTPSFLQMNLLRKQSTEVFDKLLNDDSYFKYIKKNKKIGKDEEVWQKFFTINDWILGSNVIKVLENRILDEHNVTDIPFQSYDGFLDIIELKLPNARFWTNDNCPTSELTSAIMQCARYLRIAEKQSNNLDKSEEFGCKIIKPRITLIYGRSNNWTKAQQEQFRVLNATLTNITVLSYDHVLLRANKIAGLA
ncbi:DUF4263 domain-containing protein [Candidatus Saccharibacteria bacterium]|nr:DUF4263 domain-containing protein [Candidatus Saccharibacteria bacterium]